MENKLLINLKVVSTPVKVRKGYLVEATFKRRSGKLDKFDLVFKDTEFFNHCAKGMVLKVVGRAFAEVKEDTDYVSKMYILADEITELAKEPRDYVGEIYLNDVEVISREPIRKSYDGTDKDVMNLVVRAGEDGIFHITTWNYEARFLNDEVDVGDTFSLCGRLQEFISKRTGRRYFSINAFKVDMKPFKADF